MSSTRRHWVAGLLLILMAGCGATLSAPLPAPDVPSASEIYDASGRLLSRLFVENRTEVPLRSIPVFVRQAIVAIEDQHFYSHHGIEPSAIIRAAWRNLRARRVVEGGSTLTQQLAKNLYLSQQQTWLRKVREAILTLKLEANYSKDEILTMYLNTIYLGEGAYGIETAAQTYYGKPVSEVTLPEGAMLVGLARGPSLYDPVLNPQVALQRRNQVLDRMAELNYITPAEAAQGKAAPLGIVPRKPQAGAAPYFVQYVIQELRDRYPDVGRELLSGGYRVETTLDPTVQKAAEDAMATGLPAGARDKTGVTQPQGALSAVDPNTGAVLALVGGRDFKESPYNRAVQAKRQPGSSFKPFLYAAVIDSRRYSAASVQTSEPTDFPAGAGKPPWHPINWEPGHPYANKPIGVREAVRVSDNIVAAKWMQKIGPNRVAALAHSMGISSALGTDLTLSLGTSEVAPIEMARGFAPFANGGMRVELMAIRRVIDRSGRVVVDNRPSLARVLDERVAYIMTDIMRDVVRPGGTAGQVGGMLGGRPAAGKSGTTEHNSDAWFVGFTPDIVAAVWLGNDNPAVPFGMGGRDAAPVWARFVRGALAGKPYTEFSRPPGVATVEICTPSGLLPNLTCPISSELFITGTEPTATDSKFYWPSVPGVPKLPFPTPSPSAPIGPPVLGPPGPTPESPAGPPVPDSKPPVPDVKPPVPDIKPLPVPNLPGPPIIRPPIHQPVIPLNRPPLTPPETGPQLPVPPTGEQPATSPGTSEHPDNTGD